MSCGSPSRFSGIACGEAVAEVGDEHGREVGLHQSGRDADDPGGAEFATQLASQVDQCRLGEVVHTERALGAQPADRSDVDDHARLVAHRLLPRGLAPEQRAAQVDLERLVEPSLVDAQRRPVVGIGRGVVDEDVEAAESFDRCRNARLGRVDVAGVCSKHSGVAGRSLTAAISNWSCLRELSMTLAPASAIEPAIARPIPFDAPVTSATLPSSEICMPGS